MNIENGIHEKCVKMILDRLVDNPIYVKFDLDCLRSNSCTSGVTNIEPAYKGFNMDEAFENLFNEF